VTKRIIPGITMGNCYGMFTILVENMISPKDKMAGWGQFLEHNAFVPNFLSKLGCLKEVRDKKRPHPDLHLYPEYTLKGY